MFLTKLNHIPLVVEFPKVYPFLHWTVKLYYCKIFHCKQILNA